MRDRALGLVESTWFQPLIMALIAANAVTIGMETMRLPENVTAALGIFDLFCIAVYTIEAALKIAAYRTGYFRDAWNVFDFIILLLCLVPLGFIPIPVQVARILRVLRAFRVFRLVSGFRQMRVIVEAIGRSIPGVCWTAFLLVVIFYVYAVIGTTLFGDEFPELFGSLPESFFTLFQLMTLEGWAMEVARPVGDLHMGAGLYFVSFIIVSAFIVVNVVVGIIVGTIDEAQKRARMEEHEAAGTTLEGELEKLREQMQRVECLLQAREAAQSDTASPASTFPNRDDRA